MLDGVGADPLGDKLHRAAQRRRLVVEEGLLKVDLRARIQTVGLDAGTPVVDVSHHPASKAHLQLLLRPVGQLRVFGLGGGGCDLADDPAALGSATGHEGSQELPELACDRHETSQPITTNGRVTQLQP